jgi:hypothetical protein
VTVSLVVQCAGSVLLLVAFLATLFGVLRPQAVLTLAINVLGSGALALDAVAERQWGFLLLQGVWSLAAAIGLVHELRKRRHASGPAAQDTASALTPGQNDTPQRSMAGPVPVQGVNRDASLEP